MKKTLILILINFFLLSPSTCFATGKAQYIMLLDPRIRVVPVKVNNLQPQIPDEYKQVSKFKISSIDPSVKNNLSGAFHPGLRGSNQLVIYTSKYGKTTLTNEYGKEATVIGGRVTGFNGADSFIPPNGYIVSGHGEAKKWINQNLIEGAYVSIDPSSMTVESVITPESHLYKAEYKIREVRNTIISYKNTLPGYESISAEKYFASAVEKYNKAKYYVYRGKYEKALEDLNKSLMLSEEAFYRAIPAVRDELHGVWVRPVEKTPSEIVKTLKEMKKTGIENIFLETFYHGYTIFPSKTMQKYGLALQREEFSGWNPLKVWVEEAHKRGMKVHVWVQAFYVGNDNLSESPGHILSVYPEWANVQRKNARKPPPQPSKSEHNGYFLDPANHMVIDFLYELISEMSTDYKIDGLNIDYARYPRSLTTKFPSYLNSTWGYSKYARDEFQQQQGKDPLQINPGHTLWKKWTEYRQDKITGFVSGLKPALNNKNILVSAVIFPDIEQTRITKLQNWQKWSKNCSVDAFTPLIMSSDEFRARNSINEIRKLAGNEVKIYAGLFEPFSSGTSTDLLRQIVAVRGVGATGIVLFDKAHLDERYIKALRARIFRN